MKTRLVIRTSRTVGSAKKFVKITSSFGGGRFARYVHVKNWNLLFYWALPFSRLVIPHKQNSRFCKEIRADNFRFLWRTLRKVCTCQKLKFVFLVLEYSKIRKCYAVANAFTIRNMYSLLLYMKCNSRKINRPTKNMTKIVTLLHF